jgi:hypothetical protein
LVFGVFLIGPKHLSCLFAVDGDNRRRSSSGRVTRAADLLQNKENERVTEGNI